MQISGCRRIARNGICLHGMARLLRIVRLFRLLKIVRPLYELAQSITEALQGMFWMLVFMIVTLYSVAILCTRVIGHGNIIGEDADEDLQKIKEMFSSVSTSMFTLFGTVSSWSLMKFVPLFEETRHRDWMHCMAESDEQLSTTRRSSPLGEGRSRGRRGQR